MIVIYGIKEHLNPIKAQLSDVIHGCMRSVLGMPEDKRAHRFIPMDAEDFYYPGGRTPAYTAIVVVKYFWPLPFEHSSTSLLPHWAAPHRYVRAVSGRYNSGSYNP